MGSGFDGGLMRKGVERGIWWVERVGVVGRGKESGVGETLMLSR